MSAIEEVHGKTAENTRCSRTRRAINCVYCPPKSNTTTPPRSEFGFLCSSCTLTTLVIAAPALALPKHLAHDATRSRSLHASNTLLFRAKRADFFFRVQFL
jgi:hypothetical protein